MNDFNPAPMFAEVIHGHAAVAIFGKVFAAKQASVVDEFPGHSRFNGALAEEFQKPEC
ncbi:MAG: hypothetical protein H6824_15410 [Planctomycetaceae bacterium]|nr:hypothetical protein [Planctomycetaceae bacterium]